MDNFEAEVNRGLISRLHSRRIPFTSFILDGTTAVINILVQSPAGQLSIPFTLVEKKNMLGFKSIWASSTGTTVKVSSISAGISWITQQIRKVETKASRFTV